VWYVLQAAAHLALLSLIAWYLARDTNHEDSYTIFSSLLLSPPPLPLISTNLSLATTSWNTLSYVRPSVWETKCHTHMKQYEKLTGGQGVEYLNVQVAGTYVYRCKLSANGSVCNVSVWYFYSSRSVRTVKWATTAPVTAVPASRSFSFSSTDGTRVVWQYGFQWYILTPS
jgi:hypothetical protein